MAIYSDGSDSYLPHLDPEERTHLNPSLLGPPPVRTPEERAALDAAVEAGRRLADSWFVNLSKEEGR